MLPGSESEMLLLLGIIALELSSLLFQCHVVKLIVLLRLKKHKSKLKIFSEAISELINHALLIRDVLFSKASEPLKQDVILVNKHTALL